VRRWTGLITAAAAVGAVAELAVIGVLIWRIGPAWTIALFIAKGVVGYLLARRAGRRGWRQFRAALDGGRPPGREATDAAIALVGSMLIMLTGVLGAVVGAVLLIPSARRSAAGVVERIVERRVSPAVAGSVFGPRRVRVKRESSTADRADDAAADGHAEAPGSAPSGETGGPAIEGEIVPPR
jgi:UPF0716 protein FxsA